MSWSRLVSGIVAIIVALVTTLLGGWSFVLFFAVIAFLGQREYFELVRAKGLIPAAKTTFVLSQVLLLTAAIRPRVGQCLISPPRGHDLRLSTLSAQARLDCGYFYLDPRPVLWRAIAELLDSYPLRIGWGHNPLHGFSR